MNNQLIEAKTALHKASYNKAFFGSVFATASLLSIASNMITEPFTMILLGTIAASGVIGISFDMRLSRNQEKNIKLIAKEEKNKIKANHKRTNVSVMTYFMLTLLNLFLCSQALPMTLLATSYIFFALSAFGFIYYADTSDNNHKILYTNKLGTETKAIWDMLVDHRIPLEQSLERKISALCNNYQDNLLFTDLPKTYVSLQLVHRKLDKVINAKESEQKRILKKLEDKLDHNPHLNLSLQGF